MTAQKERSQPRIRNYLEPITSKKKRRKFLVYDIESKAGDTREPGFTRPFLVGFFDPKKGDKGYQEFRDEPHLKERPWERRHILPGGCVDKFLSTVLVKKYKNHVLYAHNGGNFDHLFMLAWLKEHEDEYGFEVVPVQSSIQMVRVWRKPEKPDDPIKEKWEFLDSFKLFPKGLDQACKTFGLPGKEEFNLSEHEDHPLWSVYLRQDCIALATVLTKMTIMIEDLGGEVGITAPSTAMRLFRRKYMGHDGVPDKIPRWLHWKDCPNKNDDSVCGGCLHDWIRRGYYGGRTEIFRFRGSGLHYFDLNSSYVASMKYHMPIGDRVIDKGRLDWRRHHSPENPKGKYSGFCECEVYIPPDCPVPPLPHRAKDTGKLIFPSGVFHGVWSVEELALLKDPFVGGEIRKIRRTVWFKLQPMFRQMVDALWQLRDKKRPGYDKGLDELAKLLGNSTYGKFAMKRDRSAIVFAKGGGTGNRQMEEGLCFLCGKGDEEREVPLGGICTRCQGSKPAMKEPEGDVWYQATRTDASYVIPHVAAHITTLSRIALWRYMKMAVEMGGTIYYSDSVTGDRTTVVRNPQKMIEVLPLEELWNRGKDLKPGGTKERRTLLGYEALSHNGWSPIKQIIRHQSGKPTHRVSMKDGQTQVTPDHGIMVNGKEVDPQRFVKEKMSFTRATVPPVVAKDEVDLYEFVKGYVYEREIGDMTGARPDHQIVRTTKRRYRFAADKDAIWLTSEGGDTKELNSDRIQRRYRSGSKELHALLRLTGAYVSDGSVSLPGSTTKTRFMLSFCKSDLSLMKQLAADLTLLVPDLTIMGPFWTDTVYVVRSGTVQMSLLFDALMGHGHLNKKLPSFVYHLASPDFDVLLKALENGDGGRDPITNAFLFTSTSQRLTAGVSYLLSQHEYEHAFHFRPAKGAWSIRTRPAGSARKRVPSIGHEVFESKSDEYVYDLSVEDTHTFVDGIGQVLLHNTDSLITDVMLPCSQNLGEMKDEYPDEELDFVAIQPKVYMISQMRLNEQIVKRQAVLHAALSGDESYDASTLDVAWREAWETDDAVIEGKAKAGQVVTGKEYELKLHSKVTMKGFPPRMRTRENLDVLIQKGKLEWEQLEKVRSLARKGFKTTPQMKHVEKSFRSTYDKRIVLPDGGTSSIVLNEPMLDWEEAS